MQIEPYEPSDVAELTEMYNRAIARVPHCYPTKPDRMASAVAGETEGESKPDPGRCLVARGAEGIVGFARATVRQAEKAGEPIVGDIPFLWHEPGHRQAGQALLEAAESYLLEGDAAGIEAFCQLRGFPFYYIGWAYLSEKWGHVEALFALNGYARTHGEVILEWPDYAPRDPRPLGIEAEIRLNWEQAPCKRPGLAVTAHSADGEEIGVCDCNPMAARSGAPPAEDWFLTAHLYVAGPHQGKGLGAHLLQRALNELHGAGYRHALISAGLHNYRAHVFYTNFGYRVADWTYGLRRECGG